MSDQQYSFFESVVKSFDKASKFTKWENGLLEQIKSALTTEVLKRGGVESDTAEELVWKNLVVYPT